MRLLIVIILSLFFSGCNTRIAWEDGRFTIDPFGGKYATDQQENNSQNNNPRNRRQCKQKSDYSATNPNHSMIQFNANKHSFGNL